MSEKQLEGEVECLTLYGEKKRVPRLSLAFRPGAYALIYRAQKIVLVRGRLNGKWSLPGGGVEIGESLHDALRREVKEETGHVPGIYEHVGVWDQPQYFDQAGRAYHVIANCWTCSIYAADLKEAHPVLHAGDPDEGQPAWVDVGSLLQEDCHGLTWEIVCEFLYRRGDIDWWPAIVEQVRKKYGPPSLY